MPTVNVEFQFPMGGLFKGVAINKQPSATSGHLSDVRPFDSLMGMGRGGPRPAQINRFSQQIAGSSVPVVWMGSVTVVG